MKKVLIFVLTLTLLCGCGGGNAGDALAVRAMERSYIGECDAPIVDGACDGQGRFVSEDGWQYDGSFNRGVFGSGTVKDFPLTVDWNGSRIEGSYSGSVTELEPGGQGRLLCSEGSFEGSFVLALPVEGECIDFPCSISCSGQILRGIYTGPVSGGVPEGEGLFVSEENGRSFRYEGGFTGGVPAGEGVLSDSAFLLRTASGTDRGSYVGSVFNGAPQGEGEFSGRNGENVPYRYTGSWNGGKFDGQGSLICESDLYYPRVGCFTAGEFTPTGMEALDALCAKGCELEIPAATREYLEQFPELFDRNHALPEYNSNDYRQYYNIMETYRAVAADPEAFEASWITLFNYRIMYQWTVDFSDGYSVRCVLATTQLYTEPVLLYVFGSCALNTASGFNSYAIPLGMSTYTNVNGDEIAVMPMVLGAVSCFR